jgi:hypothetical protein
MDGDVTIDNQTYLQLENNGFFASFFSNTCQSMRHYILEEAVEKTGAYKSSKATKNEKKRKQKMKEEKRKKLYRANLVRPRVPHQG